MPQTPYDQGFYDYSNQFYNPPDGMAAIEYNRGYNLARSLDRSFR